MQSSCVWVWPGLAELCSVMLLIPIALWSAGFLSVNAMSRSTFHSPSLLCVALQAKQSSQKLNTGRLDPSRQLAAVAYNVPRGSS